MTARCAATHHIAAYVFFRRVLDEMHILKVATARPWQRRQGAWLLMDEAIRRARKMGLRQVFLEVRASNIAAIRLYEKTGFTVAGRRPGYYYDDNDDAIMMIHTLKEA
jgi:ribosomal-protein-alanine N-acetyltransferase